MKINGRSQFFAFAASTTAVRWLFLTNDFQPIIINQLNNWFSNIFQYSIFFWLLYLVSKVINLHLPNTKVTNFHYWVNSFTMTSASPDQKDLHFWPLVENEIWLNKDFKCRFSVTQSIFLSEFLAVFNDYKKSHEKFWGYIA